MKNPEILQKEHKAFSVDVIKDIADFFPPKRRNHLEPIA